MPHIEGGDGRSCCAAHQLKRVHWARAEQLAHTRLGETDVDDRIAPMVVSLGPLLANGTLWTDDLAPLPIQGETGNIESILGKCLPTMIWRHGSSTTVI